STATVIKVSSADAIVVQEIDGATSWSFGLEQYTSPYFAFYNDEADAIVWSFEFESDQGSPIPLQYNLCRGCEVVIPSTFTCPDYSSNLLFGNIEIINGQGVVIDRQQLICPRKDIQRIAAGGDQSFVLDKENELWGWGDNRQFDLGVTGGSDYHIIPISIERKTFLDRSLLSIASGYSHSLALDEQGQVWVWGMNSDGQLGNGQRYGASLPKPIAKDKFNGKKIEVIAAGGNHSFVIDESGEIWAWGYNGDGQLGIPGNSYYQPVPALISSVLPAGDRWLTVVTGSSHTLALDSQRRVWAWGYNGSGQLGNGTTVSSSVPVQIDLAMLEGAKVIAIAAGDSHSAALDEFG